MSQTDICQRCGKKIEMMVRRGTGICSENCAKKHTKKTRDYAIAA